MNIEGNIVGSGFFPHNKPFQKIFSQEALIFQGPEGRDWDFLGSDSDADVTYKHVPLEPVLLHSLFTLLAAALPFFLVYCFMLFFTMSFTFQTKTVTRNIYTALEMRCEKVSDPSHKLLHCYKQFLSISPASPYSTISYIINTISVSYLCISYYGIVSLKVC